MEHVLGKVASDCEVLSGPEAILDIVIDRRWLSDECTIDVDLPRHLGCAACEGAGCKICGQSGAITVRDRSEPPEVLRLTLPRQTLDPRRVSDCKRALLFRVQGRGGLPNDGAGKVQRGRLLLRIKFSGSVSSCVRIVGEDPVISSSTLTRADLVCPSNKSVLQVADGEASENVQNLRTGTKELGLGAALLRFEPTTVAVSLATIKPARRRWGGLPWRDIAFGLTLLVLGAAIAWLVL